MQYKIGNVLIDWYLHNRRELPWRQTKNPYFIWISEIILQQTRVSQGLPYYEKFIENFSSINLLADAPQDKILKLWQGLGYYSRARNMHAAAKQVMTSFDGKFPSTYKDILMLKGVGPYTAAAIASLAFGEPVAVVDGNVIRVISRIFGIREPVDTPPVARQIQELADELLIRDKPDLHNQAIMEFGALQCVPVNPDCPGCVLKDICLAFGNNSVRQIPGKQGKIKVRTRYFYYLVIVRDGKLFFRKRKPGDIWEGLFEFPLIETTSELMLQDIMALPEWSEIFSGTDIYIKGVSDCIRHVLTHQRLYVHYIHIEAPNLLTKRFLHWEEVPAGRLHELAIPRLIDKYIHSKDFNKLMEAGR